MTASDSGKSAATARIARHRQAGEVMQARAVLLVACSLWLLGGGALDLFAHTRGEPGALAEVLGLRAGTSVLHLAVLVILYKHASLPRWLVASAITLVFPLTALSMMVIVVLRGGVASPFTDSMYVILIAQVLTAPRPWWRGLLQTSITAATWPGVLALAAAISPASHAQIADNVTRFTVEVSVLGIAVFLLSWGGHVLWSLRQSVFESRNIGRYRLIARIGKGGMGEVWRTHDRALRRDVALKILSPEHGRSPEAIARFEREIEATAAISHPNVVNIHDWGVTDDGVWYYAMELLDGADLATMIRTHGPLPPELVVHLGVQAAAGLAEAHARGTIHRDIKPGNVFVSAPTDGPVHARLLDFGIARVDDDSALTRASAIMGTPGYMAPEVIEGGVATAASDIFGLAATLYCALTGRTSRDYGRTSPSQLVPGIPAALDEIVTRNLDFDPTRRDTDTRAFGAALAALGLTWSGAVPLTAAARAPEPSASGADATRPIH